MKSNLIPFAVAALLAMGTFSSSCSSDEPQTAQLPQQKKAVVRLHCATPSASVLAPSAVPGIKAQLTANGKALTDLFIFDYDKSSGRLLQVLHQTATATDFAEPSLTLDYGDHTLKVIAMRSTTPSLLDATATPWAVEPNVLTPVGPTLSTALTSQKTSDTFGARKDITVGIGEATSVAITLDRMVCRMDLRNTDTFPTDATNITVDFNESRTISLETFDVIAPEKYQRISQVAAYAGEKNSTISYFLLVPSAGYTTDITFTMNRQSGTPYAVLTVPSVPFARNKVTTIAGPLYNHQQGVSIHLNDEWSEDGTDINI